MDTWLAYAPVKNNPKDAAKVNYLVVLAKVSVAKLTPSLKYQHTLFGE